MSAPARRAARRDSNAAADAPLSRNSNGGGNNNGTDASEMRGGATSSQDPQVNRVFISPGRGGNSQRSNRSSEGDAPLLDSATAGIDSDGDCKLNARVYTELAGFLKVNPADYDQTAARPFHYNMMKKIGRVLSNEQPSTLKRWIVPNEPSFDATIFPGNGVDNRRYSFLTFIVLDLLQQFANSVYNVYFLVLGMSQFIPALQVGPLFTYFAPLAFVVALSMIKDFADDVKRWVQDRKINNTEYQRLKRDGTFEPVLSKDLAVGMIIHVDAKTRVPADMVLLHTSESTGTCFVRTDQLDGETDWKLRWPCKATLQLDVREIADAELFFECEAPHRDIYSFAGTLLKPGRSKEGLDVNNTVWNGCTVASGSVLGLVIHTGIETRSQMNAETSSVKVTRMMQEMNYLGYMCFCILMLLAISLMLLQLGIVGLSAGQIVVSIFRFQLLMSMILPISMAVNIELARVWNSVMIMRDQQVLPGVAVRNMNISEELGRLQYLFSDKTGTLTKNVMEFRNLHLDDSFSLEDSDSPDMMAALGIYFDRMRDALIGGGGAGGANLSNDSFAVSPIKPSPVAGDFTGATPPPKSLSLLSPFSASKNAGSGGASRMNSLEADDLGVSSATLARQRQQQQDSLLEGRSLMGFNRKQCQLIGRAVLCLSLCHQVTPVRDTDTGKCEFQAASPDEISMVEFAAKVGVHLESRVTLRKHDAETDELLEGEMVLRTDYLQQQAPAAAAATTAKRAEWVDDGLTTPPPSSLDAPPAAAAAASSSHSSTSALIEFDVLKAFPFSSERKCMGIILRNRATRKIQYLMKGADVKMMDCIPKTDASSWLEDRCNDLARMGRRTLVFATKDLSLDEYRRFAHELNEANAAPSNRAVAVEAVMRGLERNLELVCLTGVEDQLQDNVVPTLEHLGASGIKVWMLTGDKVETARCIGRSTKLIRSDLIETIVTTSKDEARSKLEELLRIYAPHTNNNNSSSSHQNAAAGSGGGGGGSVPNSSRGSGAMDVMTSPSSPYMTMDAAVAAANASFDLGPNGGRQRAGSAFDGAGATAAQQQQQQQQQKHDHAGDDDDDGHFGSVHWSLIVDGKTLEFFLGTKTEQPDPTLQRAFLRVSSRADSVVVARCSPTQKALVVQAIMKYRGKNVRSAAIGDGGNDVSMIRAANVGIGIEGVEGKQASLAADYSITKFCHCDWLITWHGRNSYLRTSSLAQFILHRGTVYAIVQAVFSVLFKGSTMSVYNSFLLTLYATFYTMAPVFALVLNEDRIEQDVEAFPELYRALLLGRALNWRSFLQWMWLAFFQGGLLMYMTVYLFADELFQITSISFTSLILTELFYVAACVNFRVLWAQRKWALLLFCSAEMCSLLIYAASVIVLPETFDRQLFMSQAFWSNIGIITAATTVPVALLRFIEAQIRRWMRSRRVGTAF